MLYIISQKDLQQTAAYFDETYFQLTYALHNKMNKASISLEKCTLPEEKLAQFSAYVEGISIADLEEEKTNFKDGNTVRNSIIRFITQMT